MVVVLNQDGTIRYLSPSVRRIIGYAPEELIGQNAFAFMHQDDAAEQLEAFEFVVSDPGLATAGQAHSFRFRHKDGHWVVIEAVSTKLPAGPEPPGIVVNARDVTGRAGIQEAMREAAELERRFARENQVIAEIGRIIGSTLNIEEVYQLFADQVRNLIDFNALAIITFEPDGRSSRIAHRAGDHIVVKPVGTTVPLSGSIASEVAKVKRTIIVQGCSELELRNRFPFNVYGYHGGIRSWLCSPLINRGDFVGTIVLLSGKENAYRERDSDLSQRVGNQIAGAIGSARLYGNLKKAEADLAASNGRNRMILESAHDAFVGIDDTGRVVAWNSQAEKTFGWPAGEAMGRTLSELIIPDRFNGQHLAGIKKFLATGNGPVLNQRIEMVAKHRDEHEFPVEITISPLKIGDRYLFNAFVRDITDRLEAEAALRRSEGRFRTVYNSAANGIVSRSMDGMIKDMNPAFLNMLGYSLDEIKELKPGALFDTSYIELELGH